MSLYSIRKIFNSHFQVQFVYRHAEWIETNHVHDWDFRLSQRYAQKCFPVCIGRHAFAMFAHKICLRVRVTLMTLYRTLHILLLGFLLYACTHTYTMWGYLDRLVCGPLDG